VIGINHVLEVDQELRCELSDKTTLFKHKTEVPSPDFPPHKTSGVVHSIVSYERAVDRTHAQRE
jgi:hypothetical protein